MTLPPISRRGKAEEFEGFALDREPGFWLLGRHLAGLATVGDCIRAALADQRLRWTEADAAEPIEPARFARQPAEPTPRQRMIRAWLADRYPPEPERPSPTEAERLEREGVPS